MQIPYFFSTRTSTFSFIIKLSSEMVLHLYRHIIIFYIDIMARYILYIPGNDVGQNRHVYVVDLEASSAGTRAFLHTSHPVETVRRSRRIRIYASHCPWQPVIYQLRIHCASPLCLLQHLAQCLPLSLSSPSSAHLSLPNLIQVGNTLGFSTHLQMRLTAHRPTGPSALFPL